MANVPNLLSGCRLLLAPVLLLLAWAGDHTLFLICLMLALVSDAVDGWLARRLGQCTELGARLDSWSDLALSVCAPVGVWWLWPELVRREAVFVGMMLAGYTLPALYGLLKYRRFPSYHTRLAKAAAVLMGAGALLLLAGGPAWPFRLASLVVLIEALDEFAITAVLPGWHANVPSLWHALKLRRATEPARHAEQSHARQVR